MSTDQILQDYLDRLHAAGSSLRPDIRDELLDDVRVHVEEIRSTADSGAEVRQALDRLGTPEQIVAAAAAQEGAPLITTPTPHPPAPRRTGTRAVDVITLLLLVVGTAVLWPLIGPVALLTWPIGVVLLWISRSFTFGEKVLATLVWPGGILLPAALALLPTQVCTSEDVLDEVTGVTTRGAEICTGTALPLWLGLPLLVVLTAAPIVVAVTLLVRAQRRRERAADPRTPVVTGS